jgi:predicted peptidase
MVREAMSVRMCCLLHLTTLVVISTAQSQSPSRFVVKEFEIELRKTIKSDYLLYLPEEYGADTSRRWPLVLFLHGSGERGSDLSLVKRNGPPKLIEQGREFDFIVVAPQCPDFDDWAPGALAALLDSVEKMYRVDPDRVYVTGLSMGGTGTWDIAFAYPNRFAAIVPICGRVHRDHARRVSLIKHLPVWVFHGANDDIVPVKESERIVSLLRNSGANVQFTVYPDAGHDAWTQTYENDELYRWLLQHRRTQK